MQKKQILLPGIWTVIFAMLFVAPSYKKMRPVLLERNLQMREKLF